MNRRGIRIFLMIFTAGVIAGLALSAVARKDMYTTVIMAGENSSYKGKAESPVQETPVEIAENEVPAATLNKTDTYPNWDKTVTYTGGDKVVYNGKIYRAKWWTLGEIPGQSDVWEDTLETPLRPEPAGKSEETYGEPPEDSVSNQNNAPKTQTDDRLKVVGYYPDWKGYQPQKLQFDLLTHVVYAFAIPTAQGGVRPLDNPDTAARLIADAHANQVKVLLAVGGWSYNGTVLESVFASATSTSEKIRQFGDHILSMCDRYGFDGVDIDWEHPRTDSSSKDQYQELMLYLADQLHARGKVLTSAVISGVSADGNVYYDAAAHSDAVLGAVDWIHVMAYDGGDGERHSSYDFAVNCADYWRVTRQVPAEKVVLGVPFYGRPGWASYEDILAADPEAGNKDHTVVNGIDAYYNGIRTMEQKAAYVREHLGGIMIWELTQDTEDRGKSLLSAIGRELR